MMQVRGIIHMSTDNRSCENRSNANRADIHSHPLDANTPRRASAACKRGFYGAARRFRFYLATRSVGRWYAGRMLPRSHPGHTSADPSCHSVVSSLFFENPGLALRLTLDVGEQRGSGGIVFQPDRAGITVKRDARGQRGLCFSRSSGAQADFNQSEFIRGRSC